MQWRELLLGVVAILLMTDCQREFGNRNLAQLKINMTQKEVDVVRYYYQQDGEMIELHFVDNKLIHNAPRLGQPLATPPVK